MEAAYEDLFRHMCSHYQEHRCLGSGLLRQVYLLSQVPGPIDIKEALEDLWISYDIWDAARPNRNILQEMIDSFQMHLQVCPRPRTQSAYQKVV